MHTAAIVTQPPAPPATRIGMSQGVRAATALQAAPSAIPAPLSPAIVAAVETYLPSAAADETHAESVRYDDRAWLADTARAAATLSPRDGKTGKPYTLNFGPPPPGLSRVECLLWQDVGCACAKAVFWLYQWVKTRGYMRACRATQIEPYEVRALQAASPTFATLYTRAEADVRTTKVARTEDTLHAMANGDIASVRTKQDADGNVVERIVERGPDAKAIALELAALDPARYGAAAGKGGAAAVNIQVNIAPGLGWTRPVVDAVEVDVDDVDG